MRRQKRIRLIVAISIIGGGFLAGAAMVFPGTPLLLLAILWLVAGHVTIALVISDTEPEKRPHQTVEIPSVAVAPTGKDATDWVQPVETVYSTVEQQNKGTAEQIEVIERTDHLLQEFIQLSERMSEQTRSVMQMSNQTASASQGGRIAVQEAISGMDQIRVQVSAIAETIMTLARLTQRIEKIITSVSEVATQSNLLALNASIEAARAGAQGRGFAAVADEVRSLAGQSTQAASEVRTLLFEVQNAVAETIEATQAGIAGVETGVAMTREAGVAIQQLVTDVESSQEASASIYRTIRQQLDNVEEIAINMKRIDRIARRTLADTETIQSVSSRLIQEARDPKTQQPG